MYTQKVSGIWNGFELNTICSSSSKKACKNSRKVHLKSNFHNWILTVSAPKPCGSFGFSAELIRFMEKRVNKLKITCSINSPEWNVRFKFLWGGGAVHFWISRVALKSRHAMLSAIYGVVFRTIKNQGENRIFSISDSHLVYTKFY